MRVLYSAFECNPEMGSDAYVGWSWVKQMSKDNEVHVLTNNKNRESIEKFTTKNSDISANFYYVKLPTILEKIFKGRKGYFASYVVWQWFSYRKALELSKNIQFDIIHHISIADFRIVGLLWKLGIPYVFGPVGGGQSTPDQLKDYVHRYKNKEKIRDLINCFSISLPIYKAGIRKAAAVYVSNDETIEVMRKHIGNKVTLHQMCELGVDEEYLNERKNLRHLRKDKVHILMSGRMMYRKGIELLLDALLKLETEIPYVIDLYGGGHQIEEVKKQIADRSLEKNVIMHGKIPFGEMLEVYAKADIFVLPSLRETTGTAVIEAMANKLPVVALNQNGVKYLVQNDAGILVNIDTKEETIENLAKALKTLIENESICIAMGNSGYERLRENYTWEKKQQEMMDIYKIIKKR